MRNQKIQLLLDFLVLVFWGILLLRYWFNGQLKLLIHPNYFALVLVTGIALVIFSLWKLSQLLTIRVTETPEDGTHLTVFPPGWGNVLLLVTAVLGFLISPGILSSQAALQRGVSEALPVTRTQVQSFRANIKPEERSLIDWIRTLNSYPEPDAYNGQKARVTGFVVHLPHLPDNYLLICRFIITCCAVDAYPVGIPVKLPQGRDAYPPDTWLEIEGNMITETLPINTVNPETTTDKRQLVIAANSLKTIPTPADPYGYHE